MPNTFSIAFYNLENLFDIEHNEYTLDKDFTPDGKLEWTRDRYLRKIKNLSNVISKIGTKHTPLPPIFIGVAEVENKACLEDLIYSDKLKQFDYDFVHYDSPDERGIDVAFLYQKEYFSVTSSNVYPLYLQDENNNRDFTRDILLVSGNLFGDPVHIIVNHWPSRNNGAKVSNDKRIKAANLVQKIINDICIDDENSNFIIMGDFNDQPNDSSIHTLLINGDLYNPMQKLLKQKKGTSRYRGKWYLFDQIIISKQFLPANSSPFKFQFADIFNDHFLQEKSNKYKGAPKRTYIGSWHQGGYSDHFPVYAHFKKT